MIYFMLFKVCCKILHDLFPNYNSNFHWYFLKVLKHVRESMMIKKPLDLSGTDSNNIAGILAKALMERRNNMQEEDDTVDDNSNWED